MEIIKFNYYTKNVNSKTSYSLEQGESIFYKTLYLITPLYIHKKSPAFSLVSNGKHISSFFPLNGGGFTGAYKSKGLLIYLRETGLDLFFTDLSSEEIREKLQTTVFVEELFKARQKAIPCVLTSGSYVDK